MQLRWDRRLRDARLAHERGQPMKLECARRMHALLSVDLTAIALPQVPLAPHPRRPSALHRALRAHRRSMHPLSLQCRRADPHRVQLDYCLDDSQAEREEGEGRRRSNAPVPLPSETAMRSS